MQRNLWIKCEYCCCCCCYCYCCCCCRCCCYHGPLSETCTIHQAAPLSQDPGSNSAGKDSLLMLDGQFRISPSADDWILTYKVPTALCSDGKDIKIHCNNNNKNDKTTKTIKSKEVKKKHKQTKNKQMNSNKPSMNSMLPWNSNGSTDRLLLAFGF